MEPVFEAKEERMKRKMPHRAGGRKIRRALGIFLSAAMALGMLWADGTAPHAVVWAASQEKTELSGRQGDIGETYPAAALFAQSGDLNLSSSGSMGDLESKGYHWDASNKILSLKNIDVSGTVTLPDATVTIETTGECSIDTLATNGANNIQLTFDGTGVLTIEQNINLSGGNGTSLTVGAHTHVIARGGISIGASGGVDSTVTVYGTLTARGYDMNAIYAGKVVVGSGGMLEVSGQNGVLLNGMSKSTSFDLNYADVFTVQQGGCFTANCEKFNVMVASVGNFLEGSNPDKAINIPEGYLPSDCEVKVRDGVVDLVKKGTDVVYTGPLTIHENHDWSGDWNKDALHHWKVCEFEWCNETNDDTPHSFDISTGKCICGASLDVSLNGTDGLIYNGQGQQPQIVVKVDGTILDTSKYKMVFDNNINAGEASVTVSGKDGLDFTRMMKFTIGKATPDLKWNGTGQIVVYSGSPARITPPEVTLVNGEKFDGDINYSYTVSGSGDDRSGLPTNAGTYNVKAAIAEQGNYTAAVSSRCNLTINKAPAPKVTDVIKTYTCTIGSGGVVSIDAAGKLPGDRGETKYAFITTDGKSILSDVSMGTDGKLKFTVAGSKSAGDTASIVVTAEMENYENATFNVNVELVAKKIVELQNESSVSVKGGDTLTYGQALSDLTLEPAAFVEQVTKETVEGSLAWKKGSLVPNVGTETAEWIFTPKDSNVYEELTGTVAIKVVKATPNVEVPTAGAFVYHPSGSLADVELKGENAAWTVGGNEVTVEGLWGWKDDSIVPTVGNSGYTAVFTPKDTANYNTVECAVAVTVEKAEPYITGQVSAGAITYGDSLNQSALTGTAKYSGVAGHTVVFTQDEVLTGTAKYRGSDDAVVAGSFSWKDGSVKPSVADSGITKYTVVFNPDDGTNYSSAETDITLTVNKAENAPNMPSGTLNVKNECEKVSDVGLPENWQWQETDQDKVLKVSVPLETTAVYVGEDKDNYKNVTAVLTIIRAECDHKNTEIRNVRTATCQTKGYSGDTWCLDCGELLQKGTETGPAAHSGGTATCISGKICEACGTEYTEKDDTNHIHTEVRGQQDASCTADGNTGDTFCTDCGTKITSGTVIPATGHDWHVTGEEAPTATSEGKRYFACSKCGETREEVIPKLPEEPHTHSYKSSVTREATCTEAGEKTYSCACGDSYTE
ncbi:MAG TPA: hypothetical protein DCZ91_17355, partial [Lachnospiraceae bacterium]|nr:hypothetical protein [Lachnospiraceae bacterium]